MVVFVACRIVLPLIVLKIFLTNTFECFLPIPKRKLRNLNLITIWIRADVKAIFTNLQLLLQIEKQLCASIYYLEKCQ